MSISGWLPSGWNQDLEQWHSDWPGLAGVEAASSEGM
jgi:hypothetical protein